MILKYFLQIFLLSLLLIVSSCSDNSADEKIIEDHAVKTDQNSTKFKLLDTESSGIDFTNKILKEDESMNPFSFFNIYNGGGVAVGDINNDGLSDIYFTGNQVENKLYLNKGGLKFEDITTKAKVKGQSSWTTGVTMADVNGDGWLDIYVCQSGTEDVEKADLNNLLYINNGDLTFTESAKEYGIADESRSNHATFFDYDNDGDLDLYVLNHPLGFGDYISMRLEKSKSPRDIETDKLFRNNGNNSFTEVTNEAGIRNYGFGLSVTISDYNNDGWADIYVANDYSEPDHLYINNHDGTFKDDVHNAMKHISQFSMGSAAADINNDGLSDLFVVDMMAEDNKRKKTNMQGMDIQAFYTNYSLGRHLQYMQNMLQLNRGNGKFSEIAELSGIANTDWSWSPLICDLDNDGWKDIYITNGIKRDLRNNDFQKSIAKYSTDYIIQHHKELADKMPVERIDNYVYQNRKDLTFSKSNTNWNLSYKGFSNGSSYADLDNDGDLDLVVNNLEDVSMIFENHTKGNNYIRLALKGEEKNPFGIGAKAVVKTENNVQYAELFSGQGFLSSSEPILHFGLNNSDIIKELTVIWPNGKTHTLKNVNPNQLITVNYTDAKNEPYHFNKNEIVYSLINQTNNTDVGFIHKEVFYEDYDREILLPHRYSQNGPFTAVADINNDGLEDFFVGGATEQSGVLYIQSKNKKFIKSTNQPWRTHKNQEDMGCEFIDIDGDNDLDLYVVSGSNEWNENSTTYQDRIYINDGKGNFSYNSKLLPKNTSSGSCIVAADFDADGDVDVFIGGRVVPGKYPTTPKSSLLINENGNLIDKTDEYAQGLSNVGMVTGALWEDYDNDNDLDLILTGEWMPITIFNNNKGKLKNITDQTSLNGSIGWWYSISSGDFDNDGDIDFIAGNLGLNSKYQVNEGPLEVYAGDLDKNGSHDIILGYYSKGTCFPLRGRTCSSQQMPMVAEKIPTYDLFGESSIFDVYGEELNNAFHKKANWMASSYIENHGNGNFSIKALPNYAQLSVINSSIPIDINNDGNLDVIAAGNMYSAEIETVRHDASYGLILIGDGKGNFQPANTSSLFADGDVKDMKKINVAGKEYLLISANSGPLEIVSLK